MLRPLIYLSALIGLAGAQTSFNGSVVANISACPITFYGKTYDKVYVNLTENLTLCFNNYYNAEPNQDCIVGPQFDQHNGTYKTAEETFFDQTYKLFLPGLVNNLLCHFSLTDFQSGHSDISLANFGTQAALRLSLFGNLTVVMFETVVNGTTVDTFNFTSATGSFYSFFDLSGCRHNGGVIKPGESSTDPTTCNTTSCTDVALIKTSTCGNLERCDGSGQCLFDSTCTVTGPSVIDFQENYDSVPDRCTYTLLSGGSLPNFQVLANFRERRLKNVSFVDNLRLKLEGTDIQLGQGGIVMKDDEPLTFNVSTELGQNAKIFRNQTEVTAEVLISNYTTSIFFDGDTAIIRITGPPGTNRSLQGLCYNSSSFSSQRSLSSATGCEMQYSEDPDSSINCTAVTERCDLLTKAPFTACHSDISPYPHKAACEDTLCKYPSKDGLNCQFLEAYARSCAPYNAVTNWRSDAQCTASEAFCQDKTCSDHEFCGETVVGEKNCLCRAIFASPYRTSDTYGDPTVCGDNSATLTLIGCLLVEKGLDYSTLHLNDENCKAEVDEKNHTATFTFDGSNTCGAEVMTNSSHMTFENTIMSPNLSSNIITRDNQVYINFSCSYSLPDTQTMAFRVRQSSVVLEITAGPWHYTLTMKAYTNEARTERLNPSTEVQLGQKIWVQLDADGLDSNLVSLVTESCWATNQQSANSTPRYDMITAGCASNDNIKVKDNGRGTSNHFAFNMFQFTGSSGDVYLHCNVNLCVTQSQSCQPTCNDKERRRRSARSRHASAAPALITMVWTS